MPAFVLQLGPEPSVPLKNLFSHLWAPVAARSLSTHALPGQSSSFQAFLRDAIDCTTYLLGKSWKAESCKDTALWIVKEQLGGNVWGEGVLAMGGRGGGRGAARGSIVEKEATLFGQAVARMSSLSEELIETLLPVIQTRIIQECCLTTDEVDKEAAMLLPRCLPVVSAVKEANTNETVLRGLDAIITQIGSQCVDKLTVLASAKSASATVYAEIVVDIYKTQPALIDESAQRVSQDSLQN